MFYLILATIISTEVCIFLGTGLKIAIGWIRYSHNGKSQKGLLNAWQLESNMLYKILFIIARDNGKMKGISCYQLQ